jgi:hypothetical protein
MCHLWNRVPPTPGCGICHPGCGWPGFCWEHARLLVWAGRAVDAIFEAPRALVVPEWLRLRTGGK